MAEDDLMLEVGGQSVSLAEIGNVDMDGVAEVRGVTFPAGAFQLAVETAKLGIVGSGKDRKPAVMFEFNCRNVIALTDSEVDAAVVIGKTHREACLLTDPMEGLGHVKAFMADTGFKGSGSLQELLEAFKGTEFLTRITNNPDKNDTSRIYANIGLNFGRWKVAPVGEDLPA